MAGVAVGAVGVGVADEPEALLRPLGARVGLFRAAAQLVARLRDEKFQA